VKRVFFILLALSLSCQQRACRDTSREVSTTQGKHLYEVHCASCHGSKGDGKGPIAEFLWPKPRDFTSGIFKYRRTRGAVPADLDLLQTMKLGIPGTSMPGWDLLSMEDWRSILSYLKSFNPRLANEKAGPSVDTPEEPKKTPESIQSGRELYEKSGCVACHGLQGKGDGPGAIVLKDVWGDRIAPRDLTRGPLKWGNTTRDIYRTLMIGIPGTPMPGYEHTFSKEQMWSLVHYLKSIQRPLPEGYDPSSPKRNLLPVTKINGEIPLDYEDEAWEKTSSIPVFLKHLWHEPEATEWLTIKALHNDKEIAFYIQWEDDRMNVDPNQSDAAAIQLPMDTITNPIELPYLGMGSASKKVNIWEWKAGSFKDFNAGGVGQLKPQDLMRQNVTGKGVYYQGSWHVIFRRTLRPAENEDAPIPQLGYASFALWDEDLPKHRGPETFSEWIVYELGN